MLFYQDIETLMRDVHGQYIWIIGASSGIGAATARTLSQAGANIILSARRESELNEVRESLVGANHQTLAFDVSDYTETKQAFKTIKRLDRVLFLQQFMIHLKKAVMTLPLSIKACKLISAVFITC